MVAEALADTRVVLVNGARQCGKSTLVRLMADHHGAVYRSLDEAVMRRAAHEDPEGFIDVGPPMVIDEVQRAPESGEDFRGLRHLAGRLGDDFIVGIVLYTGTQTLPFGDRMRAMPLSALWEANPEAT